MIHQKGELPVRTVIIMAIMIVVLAVVIFFIMRQSAVQISQSDAEKIFATKCEQYKTDFSCSWKATYEPNFDSFLQACKKIYGTDREAFSCLMSICCQSFKFEDTECEGLCKLCKGNYLIGIKTEKCCEQFAAKCSINCEVC